MLFLQVFAVFISQAVEMAGVYDRESNSKFELALARNSWRVRASKLLKSSQKPSINQIQRLLKEVRVDCKVYDLIL